MVKIPHWYFHVLWCVLRVLINYEWFFSVSRSVRAELLVWSGTKESINGKLLHTFNLYFLRIIHSHLRQPSFFHKRLKEWAGIRLIACNSCAIFVYRNASMIAWALWRGSLTTLLYCLLFGLRGGGQPIKISSGGVNLN